MTQSDPLLCDSARSLVEQLKAKSRRRRKELSQMATPSPARNDVLPALEFIYVPLNEFPPAKRKVRKIDPAHVREVAASISALGFCARILIGKDNVRLDGEIRVEAARLLGLDRVPCIRVDHLSDEEQRLLRLAVNRLGEKGEWNLEVLKIEFEELILADAPIEISGFALDEIDHIRLSEEPETVEAGPLAPEIDAHAIARLGDVFQLGHHRVICGDATDPAIMRQLMGGDGAARLILTDEPYTTCQLLAT